jgi:hypothetical protein
MKFYTHQKALLYNEKICLFFSLQKRSKLNCNVFFFISIIYNIVYKFIICRYLYQNEIEEIEKDVFADTKKLEQL